MHACAHRLIFNKQAGQGVCTQRCRLSPLFVSNFSRLHHPDLPSVIGGLIQGEITQSLTLFNLSSCSGFFLTVPEMLGGARYLNLSSLLMANEN